LKEQFKKRLAKRLETPRRPKDKLSGFDDVYKIKLRTAGYRLAYKVESDVLTIFCPCCRSTLEK